MVAAFSDADELDDITDAFTAYLSDKKNIRSVLSGHFNEVRLLHIDAGEMIFRMSFGVN